MIKRSRYIFLFFFLALSLMACGQEVLIEGLNQRDSNDILVVLYQNGIEGKVEARKQAQEVSYAILLKKDELFSARNLLKENNLPRIRELDLEEICGKEIMIPTPEYERCRENVGRQGTIANNLMKLPEVVYASVVLNIPTVNEFATESQLHKRPTASVVIRAKLASNEFKITEPKIQRHVSGAVEGLDPRDVSVIISYIDLEDKSVGQENQNSQGSGHEKSAPVVTNNAQVSDASLVTVVGLEMTEASKKKFKIYAALALMLLMIVSAALLFTVMKLSQARKNGSSLSPLLSAGSNRKDGPKMIESRLEDIDGENQDQESYNEEEREGKPLES